MLNKSQFYKNRHSYYYLKYNLVVSIFEAKKIITSELEKELNKIIFENLKSHKCLEINVVVKDRSSVVISFQAPPQVQLSVLVNNLKTVSSRMIRKKFRDYLATYGMSSHLWDMEYCITTLGCSQ